MSFSVYILKSVKHDRFYVGQSENPQRRLKFHNSIEKGFTSRYRPWEMVFTKEFPNKRVAQAAERTIKSWKSKARIQKLVNGEIQL